MAARGNTMKSQHVTVNELLPGFVVAEKAGVVRIAELQSQGVPVPAALMAALSVGHAGHKIALKPVVLAADRSDTDGVIPSTFPDSSGSRPGLVDNPASPQKAGPRTGAGRRNSQAEMAS